MKHHPKFLKVFATLALGAALVATNAGVARADDYGYITKFPDSVSYGTARFSSDGDRLKVCDSRRDGYSVTVAVWNQRDGFVARVTANGGYGTCTTRTLNLRDGATYGFYGYRTGESGATIVFWDQA
ncbi:hypothetical protein [Streptomyces hainanensis]|uniref:Streptomyces killer toxin-like beta/gamma crystallin domain-containing protein n=1 Tax=Streptomyces hainanensis TaxID=402648 RepID=A0A4R4T3F5_9ACTN|nr:hypothetical protein [Streptomyces hainanensis]TDC70276.1 hypothetical protein E1283_24925 [Streptomyces hainanensis]